MSNLAITLIYVPMALLTLGTLVLTVVLHRGKNLAANYIFFSLSVLGWLLCELNFYNTLDPQAALAIYDFNLFFVAMTSLSTLMYLLRFYGQEGYYSAPIAACLTVCPLITGVLCLFPTAHEHVRVGLAILQTDPGHVVHNVRGPWFWVHAAYCYGLVLLGFMVAILRHRRLPQHYRRTSWVLIAGMAISVSLSCLYMVGIIDAEVDFALVGANICCLFMYAATRKNQGLDFINRARVEVFRSLQSGMLILDRDRRVQGFNSAGRRFMTDCGLDDARGSFDQVLHTARWAASKVEVSQDEEGGTDYYVEDITYNIREKPILDKQRRMIGAFVVVLDVTENRKHIRKLEDDAGMDALTGLYNRLRMDELLLKLDTPENYPLAIINGDMNGLKQVNDTYGHQQGDVLLRLGAESLTAVCPPSASIGRMGGDEFMVLLPGYNLDQAVELMAEIESHMAAKGSHLYEVSMSLGAAVKENAQQHMDEVVRLADTKMYVRKNLYRTSRENRKSIRVLAGP